MGRTGSGKTTCLETLCGLRPVDAGRILLMNQDRTRARPAERGIGYVPQDGALFPFMTIRDHLAFAPRIRKWPKSVVTERVAELAEVLSIEHLLDRKPFGLSGGERQRVALGRALSFRPDILCLDEPLMALDDETRAAMRALLKSLSRQEGVTTLHVTHSLDEAQKLGTLLLKLENGAIEEVGDFRPEIPKPVFREPE
jgi:ABC-type sugar transport system ATPase subunit